MPLHEDTAVPNCKDLRESKRTSETERSIIMWWKQCAGCDSVVKAPERVRFGASDPVGSWYHMICGCMVWDGMITKL